MNCYPANWAHVSLLHDLRYVSIIDWIGLMVITDVICLRGIDGWGNVGIFSLY
jgi:hypothetical protein